jgi:peptide/nickel transport system permease protein
MTEQVDLAELPATGTGGGPIIQDPLWLIRLRLFRKSFRRNWGLFTANKIGVIGLVIIVIFALAGILHPVLMATAWDPVVYDPVRGYDAPAKNWVVVEEVQDPDTQMDLATARLMKNPFVKVGDTISVPQQPAPPSKGHWLGTDPLGRDIFSQLIYSIRAAFAMGAIASLTAVLIATSIGSVAAYYGKWLDNVLMRFADLILLVPLIPILIVVAALFTLTLPLLGILIGLLSGFGGTAIVL